MKSVLIAIALIACLATPAAAQDGASRVDIVQSRTNQSHADVPLIRCAEGWVPYSSNCATDAPAAGVTPSPIPGPESLWLHLHTKSDAADETVEEKADLTKNDAEAQRSQTSTNQVAMR